MGLPSVLLVVAQHQLPVAAAMAANTVGVDLGWFSGLQEQEIAKAAGDLLRDSARRKQMAEGGRRLVDGQGAQRVTRILYEDGSVAPAAQA